MRVVIRKNDNGRIYGITFIDDEVGIALNGSRLGKGYAANVFNSYFSNPAHNPFLDETLYGSPFARLEQSATGQPLQSNAEEGDNLVDELRIWWVTLSYLRTTMIGKKRLGSVNFAGKAKSILDTENININSFNKPGISFSPLFGGVGGGYKNIALWHRKMI